MSEDNAVGSLVSVTKCDYALNWKMAVPESKQGEFVTATDVSQTNSLVGTLDVLVFLQPTSNLYFKLPREAAAVFTYIVNMERMEDVESSVKSTLYPFVWRGVGPVELKSYFGY